MIRKDFLKLKITSHMTPMLYESLSGEKFAIFGGVEPGFFKVDKEVTTQDVLGVWTRKKPKKIRNKNQEWQVDGSKGKTYMVKLENGQLTCSCPGFSFRRKCKHSALIKEKLN